MKRLFSIITAASALLGAYSCQEISPDSDATGYLNVNVEQKAPDITYVKSTGAEDETISLKIYDNVGDLVKEVEDYTSMGTLELRTGFYKVVAYSGDLSATGASFDSPVYSGEKELTIRRGQTENLDIVCTLANIKITVTLDEKIKDRFKEYKFVVRGNDNSVLEYNQALDNFSREGYFPATATELTWELSLVSNTDIAYKTISGTYNDVKARQHYRFNFSLVEEEVSGDIGGSIFTIRLDDSLNQKDYDINLDFGKKNPTVTAGDLNLSNIEHYTGDACTVSVASESHIQSLMLTHANEALETAGLDRSVELAGADAALLARLAGIGIRTEGISSLTPAANAGSTPESADIDFSDFLSSLPKGTYTINITVRNEDGTTEAAMHVNVLGKRPSAIINAVSVNETWAMFAKVSASYKAADGTPEGFGFRYRAADSEEWAEVSSVNVDRTSGIFSAEIRGLQPSQNYIVKAICSDTEGPETSFTTESAEIVPNLGFDDWYKNGDIWYPGLNADYRFWDTANGGSATAKIYPTLPEESVVVSGKAARLESKEVKILTLNILAAGNIYTGTFIRANISMSKPGAQLDWGVPFKSRPLALKGHYQYTPQAINKTKAPYEDMAGKTDIGQIQIMLTDWDAPFRINTSEGVFVDINDSHIIGYGTMDLNETSGYQEFTINVDYRDRTRTPKYIVIVASASKYGDYFTGGVGSTLYLDEFELVYDPDRLN